MPVPITGRSWQRDGGPGSGLVSELTLLHTLDAGSVAAPLHPRWRCEMALRADESLQLSRDQIVAKIEQGARKRRNMTARELLRAYCAGELPEPGQVADLLVLADLLPTDDPLLVGQTRRSAG